MGDYLAQRIIDGAFTYSFVISKKPTYKNDINDYLRRKNYEHLIVE